jgi:hypothetical protein
MPARTTGLGLLELPQNSKERLDKMLGANIKRLLKLS